MKKVDHLFVDGTYFRPLKFMQIIVIMYIDILIGYKIPGKKFLYGSSKVNRVMVEGA